jgi:hypothetical protein
MTDCCEGTAINRCSTLQDQAEAFWHRLAPDIPPDLLTRIAFHFSASRRAVASDRRRKIADDVNASLGRPAFTETPFGYIVFADLE